MKTKFTYLTTDGFPIPEREVSAYPTLILQTQLFSKVVDIIENKFNDNLSEIELFPVYNDLWLQGHPEIILKYRLILSECQSASSMFDEFHKEIYGLYQSTHFQN